MRDLTKYQEDYLKQPYERFHKKFRSEWVVKNLLKYGLVNADILEVGCGTDSIMGLLDEFKSFDIVEPGHMFYDGALNARKKHPLKESIGVYNGYLEGLSDLNAGKSYDLIIISALLHEITDQNQFLSAVRKIAHKDTIVHFDVPNAHSFHRMVAAEMGAIDSVYAKSDSQTLFQQNAIFDVESLKDLLGKHQFSIVEVGTFIFKPFTHAQMQRLIDEEFFDENLLKAIVAMDKYIKGYGSEIFAVCQV